MHPWQPLRNSCNCILANSNMASWVAPSRTYLLSDRFWMIRYSDAKETSSQVSPSSHTSHEDTSSVRGLCPALDINVWGIKAQLLQGAVWNGISRGDGHWGGGRRGAGEVPGSQLPHGVVLSTARLDLLRRTRRILRLVERILSLMLTCKAWLFIKLK